MSADEMEKLTVRVKLQGLTYLARVPGQKKTASCTYSADVAARALARKFGFDDQAMTMVSSEDSCNVYQFCREVPA